MTYLSLSDGAARMAARIIGISKEEYIAKQEAGYGYCKTCRGWVLKVEMSGHGLYCMEHYKDKRRRENVSARKKKKESTNVVQ